jgi:hypothetical protein
VAKPARTCSASVVFDQAAPAHSPSQPPRTRYLHGPITLIEYDNTQNDANHIHSVWHDLTRNFGRDLLREHYAHGHAHG